jgi:hypothetical protein
VKDENAALPEGCVNASARVETPLTVKFPTFAVDQTTEETALNVVDPLPCAT